MTEYEKQLAAAVDRDYLALAEPYREILALHTANLVLYYGTDEKKTYNNILQLAAVSAQALHVAPGKLMAKTGMPEGKVTKLNPGFDTLCISVDYVTGKDDLESARELLIGIHAAMFLRHVKAVVESEEPVVIEYAAGKGWDREWKQRIDQSENPRLYFQQNYVQAAFAYGVAVTEDSLQQAGKAVRAL